MKWRTTAVYFLVLLLIGGIYLLMDAKKRKRPGRKSESRRVFAFDAGAVKEIEIRSGETKAIRLEKGEKWRISEPIASDVDSGEFAGFFSTLQHIEQERKIGKPSDNPDAFGLNKPSLMVRLLAGSDWLELRIGGKNPAETSRYAKAGEGGDVFMMSGSTYSALNKGLKDLRRKDLFTWQPDQVQRPGCEMAERGWNSASSGRVGQSSGNLPPSPASKSKPGRSKTCSTNSIGCGLWISLKKTPCRPQPRSRSGCISRMGKHPN